MFSPEEESCVFNLERVLVDSLVFHSLSALIPPRYNINHLTHSQALLIKRFRGRV